MHAAFCAQFGGLQVQQSVLLNLYVVGFLMKIRALLGNKLFVKQFLMRLPCYRNRPKCDIIYHFFLSSLRIPAGFTIKSAETQVSIIFENYSYFLNNFLFQLFIISLPS